MWGALRPMYGIPVNFQIGSNPHAARSAGSKDIGQIKEDCLLSPGGKAQIVPRRNTTAVAIRNFQAQPMRAPPGALSDGHVHRRLSVVDRALRDEKERAAFRRVLAELDFEIMIAGYSLILASAEAGQRLTVEGANDIGDVLAGIVDGANNLVRSGDRCEAQLQGRNDEALVDKNLRAHGMVDGHERQIIVVINLPQLCRDAQVVIAVVRYELVAANLVSLTGGCYLRRAECIDPQADGGTPGDGIFDELHLLAVVREEEWARSLQALLSDDVHIRFHAKFGAHGSIWPDHPHDLRLGLLPQAEMKLRTGDRLFLDEQARANFNFATDSEWVDALIADGLYRVRPNYLPVIIFRSLIDCLYWLSVGGEAQEIKFAVPIQVRGIEHQRRPRRMVQRHEVAFVIAEPNHSARCTWCLLRGSQKDIERTVVIEVSHAESHLALEVLVSVRDSGNLGRVPAFAFVLVGNPNDGAVSLHCEQIENSVVVCIGDRNRFDKRQTCRERTLAEL